MTDYERYQLQWMLINNISIKDLIKSFGEYSLEQPICDNLDPLKTFDRWEQDRGINGALWVCEEEARQQGDIEAYQNYISAPPEPAPQHFSNEASITVPCLDGALVAQTMFHPNAAPNMRVYFHRKDGKKIDLVIMVKPHDEDAVEMRLYEDILLEDPTYTCSITKEQLNTKWD